MRVTVSMGSKSFQLEVIDGENAAKTFGELKTAIIELTNVDPAIMKIIHRGKSLTGADDKLLTEFGMKENDKLLVMGKARAALKDDPGFAALVKYEKEHLISLQQTHEKIIVDLTELEKNYLDKAKSHDMAKKMDKRLKMFAEMSLRHLETIDALEVNTEATPAEQATRNREKRKQLVNGVQELLNYSDRNSRRLEEYTKKLNGEIIE